ncbi:MAG: LytTR family transcriptional regulator, partial [Psychrosphaera sp.]|nr:LytTR family transcriptional regulator [Psychrosphaera sp.]
KQVRVALSEVCCLEAYGNYVKVWRAGMCLLTPSSLTSFADMLAQSDFIRVHKSVIVNKSYIDYIEDNTLYLKGGKSFAIAQQHKKKLKDALN